MDSPASSASARHLLLDRFPAVLLPDHNEFTGFVSSLGFVSASYNEVPVADREGVSIVSLGTGTDGPVVSYFTVCVFSAVPDAGVGAVVVVAGFALGAFTVPGTLASPAESVRIALVARRTLTNGLLALGKALCIWSAWIGIARIYLLTPSDGVRSRRVSRKTLANWISQSVFFTSCVGSARTWEAWIWGRCASFNLSTPSDGVWLRGKTVNAGTGGVTVAVYIAVGVGAAGGGITGIRARNASVVGANVAAVTIGVSLALPTAASDGIRLGDVVGKTATQRIAGACDSALCVGTTRGWVTWIWLLGTLVVGADVARLTVRVAFAFSAATSDGVGFRNEVGETSADWVA